MKKPLKIALLSYRSHPNCGGQGIYIQQLSQELKKAGHEVTVISGKPYPNLTQDIHLIKLPGLNLLDAQKMFPKKWWHIFKSWANFYEWSYTQTGKFIEPAAFGLRLQKFFQKSRFKFDILHDNQSLSFASLELQNKYPFLTTIHHPITKDRYFALKESTGLINKFAIKRWYRFLRMQKEVAKNLKNILTVSEISKNDIVSDFEVNPTKIKVLPLGIDTDLFSPQENTNTQAMHILCISNAQSKTKGLIYLLQALKALVKIYPAMRLTIVGKIPAQSLCGIYIKKHNLLPHIRNLSGINQEQLIHLYRIHQIVVIPSVYEGFCIPALEALSMGKAIIGTYTGGIPNIVGNCGLLVSPGSANALVDKISFLLDNPKKIQELSKLARQRAITHFQWESIVNDLVHIYRKTIKNAHHRF